MSTPSSVPRQKRIQRIQLEPYDDMTSVRDRLQFVNAGRVLLIFPANAKILQRKLDLVLIQREAMRRDLRLALLSKDITIADNAKDLNISVFPTIEAARTQRWNRPQNKVFVDRQDRPQMQHDPYDLMLAATRLKEAPSPARQLQIKILRGVVFGIAILALLFGFYAVVPSATVRLTPARDEVNITINMIADPNITDVRPESLRIPATVERRLQEATVSIQSSGRRPAANSLAEGTVTFTNNTDLAQFIPAGTIVQTESAPPVQFETTEDAALPARLGASVNVSIRGLATNQGLSGNQPPNSITRIQGNLSTIMSVRNLNATYGEGVRELAFVTDFDHERLLTLARQQLRQNARDNLIVSLDEANYLLVTESIRIVSEREFIYTADVNQATDTVSLTLKASIEATIIDLSNARLVAFANMGRYVTTGRSIDEKHLSFRNGEVQQILEDGSIAFQMRIEGTTYVSINSQSVRERLSGLSANEAREVLENEYLLDPRYPPVIETWPSFFKRMPIFPIRIHVDVQDDV